MKFTLSNDGILSAEVPPRSKTILGTRVDATSYDRAIKDVLRWSSAGESRYICVSTVHMIMEGYDSREYQDVVNGADLVTPDGMPLVWHLRRRGIADQSRVYGPDLTRKLLGAAADAGIPVGFYGGDLEVLERLLTVVGQTYPELIVAYAFSPPFRELTSAEDAAVVNAINKSGTRILFVGLGCPKQERWMAGHRGRVKTVMLGVGAAFDFLAGTKAQAPRWIMGLGLEWLYRFCHEPRRLWKRYLRHNPRFVLFTALSPRNRAASTNDV
ncbi:WecB/TagA/CpsF family glycosyltransferase [Singulisphaera rosea]